MVRSALLVLAAVMLMGQGEPPPASALRRVISVHDGDSIRTREDGAVRFAGGDAPEIGSGARCPAENALAIKARDYVAARTSGGVALVRRHGDRDREKYGRLLRRPIAPDGGDIVAEMISLGLAVAYEGRGLRKDWCRPGG